MLRLGYFGDGPWAHRAFDLIVRDPRFEVAFVVARSQVPDPALRERARAHGLPFLSYPNVNADAALAALASYDADLFVSMSFDQIFRAPFLSLPPLGVINCHAGALPRYRGRNVLNWALINGEQTFGVSVHYVDEGIDTGDLLKQTHVPIAPTNTYREVLAEAHHACADTLLGALGDLAEGRAERRPQGSGGFYCGRRRDGDEWLDWRWSSARLHNFVRGVAPPAPGARSVMRDQEVAILRSTLLDAPPYLGTPGEVVGRSEDGVRVKTGDGVLELNLTASASAQGLSTPERPRFPIGARFIVDRQAQRLTELERDVAALRAQLAPDELPHASNVPEEVLT